MRVAGIAGCVAGAILATADGASADVVRLANGDVLEGDVTATGPEGIRVQRYDTGGVVRLAWGHVLSDDRAGLQRRFGLDADAAARELFEAVQQALAQRKFADAAAAWRTLMERYPDSAAATEHAGRMLPRITAMREAYLDSRVRPYWNARLRVIAAKRSRTREDVAADGARTPFGLRDAIALAHRTLGAEVAAAVAETLGITPDEARAVFAKRQTYELQRATYGGGTFIVQAAAPGRAEAETWWTRATGSERQAWMTAFYAEHGGDMQVVRIEERACKECEGRGYKIFPAPGPDGDDGEMQYKICSRCHGLNHDRVVVFK